MRDKKEEFLRFETADLQKWAKQSAESLPGECSHHLIGHINWFYYLVFIKEYYPAYLINKCNIYVI